MTKHFNLFSILENQVHQNWSTALLRHPDQLNRAHESDAELIPLPSGDVLAATIDTVDEEIALGIYDDPETIGWVGAVASLSDLAACGAEPIGLLVSVTLPKDGAQIFQKRLAQGLDDACRKVGTFVLGGDTNIGKSAAITTCGLGLVRGGGALTRTGMAPGDDVYVTGQLGLGAVAAARSVLSVPKQLMGEDGYRPVPRLDVGQALRGIAGVAMDTSDGFLATLDQLMRLNGLGFIIDAPLEQLVHRRALTLCRHLGFDSLLALAVHHGEFELVLTAPPEQREVISRCTPSVMRVGQVTDTIEVTFLDGGMRRVDTGAIRNLSWSASGEPLVYLEKLRGLIGVSL